MGGQSLVSMGGEMISACGSIRLTMPMQPNLTITGASRFLRVKAVRGMVSYSDAERLLRSRSSLFRRDCSSQGRDLLPRNIRHRLSGTVQIVFGMQQAGGGGRISALTREAEHRVHPVALAHSRSENPVRTVHRIFDSSEHCRTVLQCQGQFPFCSTGI
jgi:hypothetical protein